jgi:nitroimidazol reductase NimA-like FMN-containing flavoprotein (pyridoxamine 5'-phosphate oxidase superfamily)
VIFGEGGAMRKKDREITDQQEIEAILARAQVCRIGMSDGAMPYIVPVNYGYAYNCLYIHSSKKGKKIDILRKNNNVCFEVEVETDLIKADKPCDFSVKFRSVIGFGKAVFVEDYKEKLAALNIIMEHYTGKSDYQFEDKPVELAQIIKVEITSMIGKRSKPTPVSV